MKVLYTIPISVQHIHSLGGLGIQDLLVSFFYIRKKPQFLKWLYAVDPNICSVDLNRSSNSNSNKRKQHNDSANFKLHPVIKNRKLSTPSSSSTIVRARLNPPSVQRRSSNGVQRRILNSSED